MGGPVMGDVEDSQAVRDSVRAGADLERALRAGATLSEIAELTTAKANADERVATLRRRVARPQATSQQTSADVLQRRVRRRAVRAETDEQNPPT